MKLFSQYRGLRRGNYVLFFGRIVTNLGAMVWPMLTMILTQKLDLTAGQAAIVVTVSGFLLLPVSLLGGRLADRRNKKMVIVVCDLISIFFYLLCGLLPLTRSSILLLVGAAVCQSMEEPAYNALIADLTPTADRERAYSLQYLGANLGLVLSPTIGGLLFKNYLWLAFLISGFAIACSTALIYFTLGDITPVEEGGERAAYQEAKSGAGLGQVLRENPVVLLYLVALGLYYTCYGQFSYLMPLDMGRVHGADGAAIYGTVTSLNCVVVVLFTPLLTRWSSRLSEPRKFLAGQLLVLAGYVCFALLLGHIPAYYAAITLFTWGEILATLSEGPYLTNRVPASHRGRVNGFRAVVSALTGAASRLITGGLYDRLGSQAAWGFTYGVMALVLLLTALLSVRDRRVYAKLYR